MDKIKAEQAVKDLLIALGKDINSEGLKDTPKRVAKMYEEILNQEDVEYSHFTTHNSVNMVLMKDIEFNSMCEHHLMPFSGKVHLAYVPEGKVVGLSKLARVVSKYANDLQLQERMMGQIVEELTKELGTVDIAIVIEAQHYCMISRGAKSSSTTITSQFSGEFRNADKKMEFLSMIK